MGENISKHVAKPRKEQKTFLKFHKVERQQEWGSDICNEIQEIPLGSIDFPWFIDGFYLKGVKNKYCSGYTIRILLMLLRQHLYLWLCWLNRLNYMLLLYEFKL